MPLVPVVSIGGQEAQLFLTRGEWIGRHSPLRRLMRTDRFPIGFGFPFGLVPAPLNLPLPTKITTRDVGRWRPLFLAAVDEIVARAHPEVERLAQ